MRTAAPHHQLRRCSSPSLAQRSAMFLQALHDDLRRRHQSVNGDASMTCWLMGQAPHTLPHTRQALQHRSMRNLVIWTKRDIFSNAEQQLILRALETCRHLSADASNQSRIDCCVPGTVALRLALCGRKLFFQSQSAYQEQFPGQV